MTFGNTVKRRELLILQKVGDTYVVIFQSARRDGVANVLGRWASTPELNLDWHDAALAIQRIHCGCEKAGAVA